MKKKNININNYAGLWKRFLAVMIDDVVLIPMIFVNLRFNKYFIEHRMVLPIIVANLVTYGYTIVMTSHYGGTVGKLVMKIRVTDGTGINISYKKAILRSLPYILLTAFFYTTKFIFFEGVISGILNSVYMVLSNFMLIDVLVLILDSRKKSIHDYIAGTIVVNR